MLHSPPGRPVLTLGAPPDGRGAVLCAPERPPAFGALDPAALERLRQDLPALAPSGLLVPGEDEALGAAERRIGLALQQLLLESEPHDLASQLHRLGAEARASDAPLDLLLDLRGPELWALPWELLELLPAGEPLGRCRIARIVEGRRMPEARGDLELLRWSPTPDDPDCARVLAALDRTLARHPALRRVGLEDPPRGSRIVHVVCHGGERGEPVLELGADRQLDAATLGRVLEPLIRGAALVVLDVCGAGGGAEPVALPAWRVVDSGACACLAPRAALDVEASAAMSAALYGALAAGEPLSAAVQASRRAMAALGLPDPSARWWTLTLVSADPAVLDFAAIQAESCRVPDLERASPAARVALARAAELAFAQGFLGVEHLALALARLPDPPPLLALVQPQLAAVAWRAAGLQPTGDQAPTPTLRLSALLAALPADYDLVALLRALARSRPVHLEIPGLSSLLRDPVRSAATLAGDEPVARAVPREAHGLRLEVLGGPEDGLGLTLDEARPLLGRWDPGGEQPRTNLLYTRSGSTDLSVSRRHLRWAGGATVEALALTTLRRDGEALTLQAATGLRPGDLLELGRATRVEVVGVLG